MFLHTTCPSCGQHPLASPLWKSHPVKLWRCPVRLTHRRGSGRTVRLGCDTDLRTAPTQPVSDDLHAAQQLLINWAANPNIPVTACDVTITRRIGFHAFADLVDAYYDCATHDPWDLSYPPQAAADRFPRRRPGPHRD